ncbi:MAG: N-6 DNA methylase, partial [Spirochaetales bacterium]|nr:N-6 DNA methylase [Spirochaetales bacterium]
PILSYRTGEVTKRNVKRKMTLREQADRLNVSIHTLKNWQNRDESEKEGAEGLVSRANKLNSSKRIIPTEMLEDPANKKILEQISDRLLSADLELEGKVLLFMIHFLHFKGFLKLNRDYLVHSPSPLEDLLAAAVTAPAPEEELRSRFLRLSPGQQSAVVPPFSEIAALFKGSLNREYDLPGLIYQSLRAEGKRSREGAWFTPRQVIDSMLHPGIRKTKTLFDPCCGSGLFLCRFAEMKKDVRGVRGMDLDPQAVFITRINLFIRFPGMEDFSVIRESDSLRCSSWHLKENTLVATNPPWGAHLPRKEKKEMARRYPEIRSGETASLFLRRCVEELPEQGEAVFLLPSSLCYVETHKDIRSYLLKGAPPVCMEPLGRQFHSVYSEVFSCRIRKGGRQRKTEIRGAGTQSLKRYKTNPSRIFNIHCTEAEAGIIRKIRSGGTLKLPGGCGWLLGVVTGDNSRFLSEQPVPGSLPILTGKEIRPFTAEEPRLWLRMDRGSLQQSRRPEEYRTAKLVYRFIGNVPLFAIDREGMMTLNSANSLVLPSGDRLTPEELVLWYNSALFRFIWYKQYRSVKMLRHHLEDLPLPRWTDNEKREITALVQNAEKGQDISFQMNEIVCGHFGLTREERNIVLSQN